jgi:hypothetical protein
VLFNTYTAGQDYGMNLPSPQDTPVIGFDDLHKMIGSHDQSTTAAETEALERLIEIAKRDTGQSRRVADFLLAWWNSGTCGSFDVTTLWGLDRIISDDMVTVFGLIAKVRKYPDSLGYEMDFKVILRVWRPQ